MHIKIYIHNKPLYLCDALDEQLNLLVHQPDHIFIDELDTHTVKTMLHEMQLSEIKAGIFLHTDLEQLKKAFFKKFTVITAGGGLVQNEKKEVLMIFRRGSWDLPKGKQDKGETLEACAIREVKEETGLKTVHLKNFLTTTWHSYGMGTHHMLKESHWYRMAANSEEKLIPQSEEDIGDIQWVPEKDLPRFARLAYPSIADVLALVE